MSGIITFNVLYSYCRSVINNTRARKYHCSGLVGGGLTATNNKLEKK